MSDNNQKYDEIEQKFEELNVLIIEQAEKESNDVGKKEPHWEPPVVTEVRRWCREILESANAEDWGGCILCGG